MDASARCSCFVLAVIDNWCSISASRSSSRRDGGLRQHDDDDDDDEDCCVMLLQRSTANKRTLTVFEGLI